MTFTYIGDLSTDREKVRFHICDTTVDSGPRPSGANFTNEELDGLLTVTDTWQRAVAAALDRLATEWAKYADLTEGPHNEKLSQISARYAEQAKQWKKEYGITSPCRVAGVTRVDGYSDDVTSDDVNTSSEYGIVWERVTIKE